jgi:predicted dehydrogenase
MKTTVAVLGAGGWGSNWTERALRDPDCEVRAIADASPRVLERLAARGIPKDRLFADANEALESAPTDVVTCSIPNPQRVPHLLRAMDEGRHILVDKPLVHTVEALQSLMQRGSARRTVFMVAQNYRYFAGAQRVKQMLQSGDFGEVASVHVHFLRSSRHIGASYVKDLPGLKAMGLEMCIHHFDLMRFFLDKLPDTVSARAWRTPFSPGIGYDCLDVHLEYAGGVHVAYDASWGAAYNATDWNGHWEIIAEGGSIAYGFVDRAVRAFDADGKCILQDPGVDPDIDTAHSVDRVWVLFKQAVAEAKSGRPAAMDAFCPLEDNAKSLGLVLAAERSVDTGAPVDFDAYMRRNGLA